MGSLFQLGSQARLVEEMGLGAPVGRGFQAAPSAWAEAQRWESRGGGEEQRGVLLGWSAGWVGGMQRSKVGGRGWRARPGRAGSREVLFVSPWALSCVVMPVMFTHCGSLEMGPKVNGGGFKMGVGHGSCVCRKVTYYETIIKTLGDFCLNEGGNFSPVDSLKLGFQAGNSDIIYFSWCLI